MPLNLKQIILTFQIILSFIAPAFSSVVPDTGQTTCYDEEGNEVTCPQPGEDYYGQDANYTINPMSYIRSCFKKPSPEFRSAKVKPRRGPSFAEFSKKRPSALIFALLILSERRDQNKINPAR